MKMINEVKFLFMIGLCFFSCSSSEEKSIQIDVFTTPVREPWVDETFSEREKVELWQKNTIAKIKQLASVPTPEQVLAYAIEFKIDPRFPDPFIGDPTVWNANWTYSPASYVTSKKVKKEKPNVEEAKASLIQRGFKNWEAKQYDQDSDGLVADIVTFAKSNQKEAKAYVTRYLKLPQANVLIWVSCGEGCYNTPIRGSLELYQLIKDDTSLREMYFERTRQFINEAFPFTQGDRSIEVLKRIAGEHTGNMFELKSGLWGAEDANLLFTYLLGVQRLNDFELKNFWVQMLDTFPRRRLGDRTLLFEREVGRFIFGYVIAQHVQDLTPEQEIILDVLSGRSPPDLVSLYKTQKTMFGSGQVPVPDIKYLFSFLTRGNVLSATREDEIREILGISKISGQPLRQQIRNCLNEAMRTVINDQELLDSLFWEPKRALDINRRARRFRANHHMSVMDLYPDTDQEYQEIVLPVLNLLGEKFPDALERYQRVHGDSP